MVARNEADLESETHVADSLRRLAKRPRPGDLEPQSAFEESSSDTATPAAGHGNQQYWTGHEYGWYSTVHVGGNLQTVWVPVGTEVWAGYRGFVWSIFAGADRGWRRHGRVGCGQGIEESSPPEATEDAVYWPGYGQYVCVNVGGQPKIESIWVRPGTELWTGYRGCQWRHQSGGHPAVWQRHEVHELDKQSETGKSFETGKAFKTVKAGKA